VAVESLSVDSSGNAEPKHTVVSYRGSLVVYAGSHRNGCKLHTHSFNGSLSGTTQVSCYQKA